MAVITISATGVGPELVSGIPQFVVLDTNIPSTIFYTLDGSMPSVVSSVYLGAITMPTNSGSVRLRALALSGLDSGYLDVTFSTDTTELTYPRRSDATFGAGVVVDAYNTPDVLLDGYSPDAYGVVNVPVRYSDIELIDLDIQYSRTGPNREGPGTLIPIGFPPESQYGQQSAISHDASSPNNNNAFFNPRSLYIVIDGRDGYQNQIYDAYMMINRPWAGTADMTKYLQGKALYEPQPYITGGYVRTLFNKKTGTAVSYYFDHNETRWIKSIQNFDVNAVPKRLGARNQVGPPLVFTWIHNKRSMI